MKTFTVYGYHPGTNQGFEEAVKATSPQDAETQIRAESDREGVVITAIDEGTREEKAIAALFLTMPEPPLDMASLDGLQAYAEAIAQWRADCGYPLRYDGPVG